MIFLFVGFFVQGKTEQPPGTFTIGNKEFLLNGKPFVIRAAEIHFPRIPKEYWDHRIKMSKALGMNTICIYMFWNFHEQRENQFDFTGQKDVAEFVKLVQKNGMYCILRPGPYACAEWDMGGLPWWLLKKDNIQVRTAKDSYFLDRSRKYLIETGKQLAPLQIQNGGNIIMIQVENEYASFGNEQAYMEQVRNMVKEAGFDKVQLFRCDWSSNFMKYELDEVVTTINFGAGSNVENQFKKFQELNPTAPLMCSEYWTGWFDHWGKPHETRAIKTFIGSLKDMLDLKISFSLYMAHGGTSFGQWGGANSPPYSPMATSYDYNAPIGEQGEPTDKFYAIRDLLKNYLQEGETLSDIPPPVKLIVIPQFELLMQARLFDNLPTPVKSRKILTMESVNQGWGSILYRTFLSESAEKRKLVITEVHDWASVFINGKLIGKLDRRHGDNTLEIPPVPANSRLDILVEATGRVNYDVTIIDRKGITEKVELNGKELLNWQIFSFPVIYNFQKRAKFKKKPITSPGWYRGSFMVKEVGDTFLDMSTWGKGMVWVNGFNIGRFWKIGPQQTLYMPGSWLKKGKNEIIIFDVDLPSVTKVSGVKRNVLDQLGQDASLLHRKLGQSLDLLSEKPAISGSFPKNNGWNAISFKNFQQARYLCFEAKNAQDLNDSLTSIAEIDLIGADGQSLSNKKWKIIYADSEEVTKGNHAANKLFDRQESTFWQSQELGIKPPHAHQVVIDMGELVIIKAIRCLQRSDGNNKGVVKDFNIFIKTHPFKFK